MKPSADTDGAEADGADEMLLARPVATLWGRLYTYTRRGDDHHPRPLGKLIRCGSRMESEFHKWVGYRCGWLQAFPTPPILETASRNGRTRLNANISL